jgi:hypothetical protein
VRWIRDHGLSLTLFALFIASWALQFYTQVVINGDDMPTFWGDTASNWESEFLQLCFQVVLPVYLLHRGSPVSRDGDDEQKAALDRIEAKIDDLTAGPDD